MTTLLLQLDGDALRVGALSLVFLGAAAVGVRHERRRPQHHVTPTQPRQE